MSTLVLLRGLPGSGKTTFADYLTSICMQGSVYFEADMFMTDHEGNYAFDPTKLQDCDTKCALGVENAMSVGISLVIVSNTFTQEWELTQYLDMAEEFGYDVVSLVVENRHGNQSVHGVPEKSLQRMRNRFEIKL